MADPDLCYEWPRVLSVRTTNRTNEHSSTVLVRREIHRTFKGMGRLELRRSWPGFTGEAAERKKPHGTEWKKLIMEDRDAF